MMLDSIGCTYLQLISTSLKKIDQSFPIGSGFTMPIWASITILFSCPMSITYYVTHDLGGLIKKIVLCKCERQSGERERAGEKEREQERE